MGTNRDAAYPPEERELLAKITTAELPADESLKRTWSLLVKQGKTAEVNKSLVNETLPLLNKYRDAGSPSQIMRRIS